MTSSIYYILALLHVLTFILFYFFYERYNHVSLCTIHIKFSLKKKKTKMKAYASGIIKGVNFVSRGVSVWLGNEIFWYRLILVYHFKITAI